MGETVKPIPFSSLVRDNISGFEGFVVYRVEHMHKCVRYGVQPGLKDGKLPEVMAIDGPDLKVIAPPRKDLPPAIETPDTFELGVKAKDRLTGLTGVLVARIKHAYAGDRYGMQVPVDKDGKLPDVITFDEKDIEQIDPPPKPKPKAKKDYPAGPHDPRRAIAR